MHGSAEQKQAVRQAFSGIAENIAQVQALEKALVTQMLAEFPDSVEAHLLMAFVLRHHGDSEAATEYYKKALTIDPERGEIYQKLAQIAREKGQLERAAEILTDGLEKAPQSAGLFWEFAEIRFRQGHYALALACLEKERHRAPESTRVHYLLGQVYSQLTQYDLAEESFKKTIALDPNHQNAHYGLGMVYTQRGQKDQAREALFNFNRFHRDFQTTVDERDRVGDVNEARQRAAKLCFRGHMFYLQHKRPVLAMRLLDTAARLNPTDALFVETRALVAYQENQFDLALQLYDKARQINPHKPSNSLNLSKIYLKLNQPERAESVLKDALVRFPQDPRVYADLARLYLKHPLHVPKTISLAQRALQLKESAEGYYLLSCTYMANRDLSRAQQAIKMAVKLAPSHPKYRGMYDQIKSQQ